MFRTSLCPSSGYRLYKTASGVSLDVLATVVWSQDTSWAHCVNAGIRLQSNTWIHTVHSARVLTPHNRSQHIQANTTHGFIQSVLLTIGIMMPETCWVNLLWINIYTCVICWFFLLLGSNTFQICRHVRKSVKSECYFHHACLSLHME